MKFCSYCGAGLDMDMRFCPKCGKPFEGGKENPHLTAKHLKPESLTYGSVSISAPPKNKKRGGIIAIVILAMLITVGAGLYFSGFFAPKEEPKLPFSDDTVAIAEDSNSVVISEFSENNEHLSPNQVYTIDYITNNYEELDGKTISIEGYICYIDSELKTFYLISTAEDARDPNSGKIDKWGQIWLHGLLSRGEAIAINYNDNQEMLFSKWEDKAKVTITGRFSIQRNANNSLFTMSDISVASFYETFEHTPSIPVYTVDYIREHFPELDGKLLSIDGYLSYGYYIFSSEQQITNGFSGNDSALLEWVYRRDAEGEGILISNSSELDLDDSIGKRVSVTGVLSIIPEQNPNGIKNIITISAINASLFN